MNEKIELKHFLIFVYILLTFLLNGQQIIFKNISSNGVCNAFEVVIILNNTTTSQITNSAIEVDLPCNITYEEGSVTGGSEGNLSNLQNPEFTVATVASGEERILNFSVIAPCEVHSCNNTGSTYTLNSTWRIGTANITSSTESFNIPSPNPLFTTITNTFYELENQSEFTRELKIKNTRLGKLKSFTISELFNNNQYDITFEEGFRQVIGLGNIQYEFGPETIAKFGDGDDLFEYGEEIVIVEKVLVTACPYDVKQIRSRLILSWGCNTNICSREERSVLVKLRPSSEPSDDLSFTKNPTEPNCYFKEEVKQSANFTNKSASSALINVQLEVKITDPYSWISPNSLALDIDVSRYSITYKDPATVLCGQFNKSAIISIPKIDANEQISIVWNSAFCDSIRCNKVGSGWSIQYQYNKDCSSLSDRFHTGSISHSNTIVLGEAISEINITKPSPITTGSEIIIKHTFQSEELASNNGAFYLQYILPCGFTIQNSDFILAGISPIDIENLSNDSFTVLNIKYPMPFPSGPHDIQIKAIFDCELLCIESHCKKEFLGTCPFECSEYTQRVGVLASLIIEKASNCPFPPQLKATALDVLSFECDNQICIDSLPGWVSHISTIYRKTVGLSDNDDNGLPDNTELTTSSKIKRNHIMIGDTFSLITQGLITLDLQNERAKRMYGEINIEGIGMSPSDTEFGLSKEFPDFMSADGMLPLIINGQIKSNFNGKIYKLKELPFVLKSQSQIFIDLNLDTLKTLNLVPQEYFYETGDSLILDISFVVTHNFNSSEYADVLPSVMDINFNTYFGFDENQFDDMYRSTKCNCRDAVMKLGSIQYSNSKIGIFDTEDRFLCTGDTSQFRRVLSSVGVQPGFFPFEYREVYHPAKIISINDPNFILKTAKINVRNRFNTTVWDETIKNWNIIGETKSYNIPSIKFDEYCRVNWQYTAEVKKEMACTTTKPKSQESLAANFEFEQGELINQQINLIYKLETEMQFSVDYPQFKLEVDSDFSESYTDSVSWAFTLTNSSNHEPILQPFLYIQPSSLFSDFKLVHVINGTVILPVSEGIYILPDQPFGDTQYLLSGTITACDRSSFKIKYGWDCDIFDLEGEEPCYSGEVTLTGYAPPPVAEIRLDTMIAPSPLCAPSPYINVDFINAGLGSLYKLNLGGILPKGLMYIEGSSEYLNPKTNSYIPIATLVLNDSIVWDPSTFIGLSLVGNSYNPENIVSIRFKVKSTCDYTSGSQIALEMRGKSICGKSINRVKKVTNPLLIQDISSSNQISLNAQMEPNDCSDIIKVKIDLNKPQISAENKLVVSFPNGSVILSENSGLANDITNNSISFFLKDDPFQTTINLSIGLPNDLGCGTDLITIHSTSATNAFCVEDNEECVIDIIDNQINLPFTIEKPSVEVIEFNLVNISTVGLSLQYELLNNSIIPASFVSTHLILDRDNSGNFTPSDTIIARNDLPINPGTNSLSFDGLDVSDFQLCQLLLIISALENCICEDLIYPIQDISISSTISDLCQNTNITIGKDSIADASYHWSSNQFIPCFTCAYIDITAIGQSTYTLNEQYLNGCEVEYNFEILPHELPQIYIENEAICKGDTAYIYTSQNVVMWDDDAILQIDQGSYLIIPSESMLYTATLIDTLGCTVIDTIIITVRDVPLTDIPDIDFCYGQSAKIINNTIDPYEYFWIESTGLLNNPIGQNPSLLTSQSNKFVVLVSNEYCSILDTVNITFYDGLDLTNIEDTLIICFDQIFNFSLPQVNSYIWSPDYSIACQNGDCSEVIIDAIMVDTEYLITASNDEGCKDTFKLTLVPSVEDIVINEEVLFCFGDTLFVDGQEIFAPIEICDTTLQDCKTITCKKYIWYQEINALYYETSITEGESIELSINETFETYLWTNAESLSCNDCANPTAEPYQTTTYEVTVTSIDGCEITLRYKVNVITDCDQVIIVLPNAFTPNGNGENDVFRVPYFQAESSSILIFKVFNEWGMEIFDAKDNLGWDGTYKGKIAAPGTYTYLIEIGCGDTDSTTIYGAVTLIR